MDVYAAHRDDAVLKRLSELNCGVRFIPANLTSEAQPNDAFVNRIFKSAVSSAYDDWYTEQMIRRLRVNTSV